MERCAAFVSVLKGRNKWSPISSRKLQKIAEFANLQYTNVRPNRSTVTLTWFRQYVSEKREEHQRIPSERL